MKITIALLVFVFLPTLWADPLRSVLTYQGKDVYVRGDRDRSTGTFKSVPILTAKGEAKMKSGQPLRIKSGTLVRAHLVNADGEIYQRQPDFVPHTQRLVHIKVLKDESLRTPWRSIECYVSADALHYRPGRQPLAFFTPRTSQFKKNLSLDQAQKKVASCEGECAQTYTVDKALSEFHNGLCNSIDRQSEDLRGDLIERWRLFRRLKGIEVEAVTEQAMQRDLIARTILYEAHPPGTLETETPHLGVCEWDLIALSIINRARLCRSYMKCNLIKESRSASVATAPSQYHIWRQENIRNTYMTSCFLRQDLKSGVSAYLDMEPSAASKYDRGRVAFSQILGRLEVLMKTPSVKAKTKQWRNYVLEHFDVKSVNGKKNAATKKTQKAKHLLNYTHYYHRGGLLTCRVENYHRTRFVDSAYVKIKSKDRDTDDWGLLFAERIDFADQREEKSPWYEIYFPKKLDRHRLFFVSARESMDAQIYLDRRITSKDHNTLYTCLPEGKLPRCLSKDDLKAPLYGRRVPTTWFDAKTKKSVQRMYNRLGVKLGSHWRKRRRSHGKALAVTCKGLPEKPSFAGLCDPHFMPVSGAD